MPNQWHRYYFEHPDVKISLPQHIKTIEVIENMYITRQNEVAKQKQEEEENRAAARSGRPGFIHRKPGEVYKDSQGNTWQTIL